MKTREPEINIRTKPCRVPRGNLWCPHEIPVPIAVNMSLPRKTMTMVNHSPSPSIKSPWVENIQNIITIQNNQYINVYHFILTVDQLFGVSCVEVRFN